jgi:hypothetical protein
MPKGIARNPDTDKRRKSKAGGRPTSLPPGTVVRSYRATPDEHNRLKAYLVQLRAGIAEKTHRTEPDAE